MSGRKPFQSLGAAAWTARPASFQGVLATLSLLDIQLNQRSGMVGVSGRFLMYLKDWELL